MPQNGQPRLESQPWQSNRFYCQSTAKLPINSQEDGPRARWDDLREYNTRMADDGERRRTPQGGRSGLRQPGWVLLTGVLGAACLMIGLIMLPMLQAPAVRPQVIATAVVFIVAGVLLLPVAWMKRVHTKRPLVDLHPALEVAPPDAQVKEMDMYHIELTPESRQKLDALSGRTGKTRDQLINEAVGRLDEADVGDEAAFRLWQEAMHRAEGIWRDRQDLPDFDQLRRSMDRELWSGSAT